MAEGQPIQEHRAPLFVFVSKRIAEYLREGAVLIMVFAILDKVVFDHEIGAVYVVEVMASSFVFLALGIWLERRFGGG